MPRRQVGYDEYSPMAIPETTPAMEGRKKVVSAPSQPRTATKKKTKKKKTKTQQHAEAHSVENLHVTTSNYMMGLQAHIRKISGDPTMATIADAEQFMIGVPLPAFATEYLFGNNVLLLEKLIQLYGPPKIGKSGLGFEISRWFRLLAGMTTLLEHESKLNPDWAKSIVGEENGNPRAIGNTPCQCIEDWQRYMQESFKYVKRIMRGDSKTKGSGKIYPYLVIVDSIMGKVTKETRDKIEKDGFAGRGHPIEALSISAFLKAIPSAIVGWPFTILTVNHWKPGIDGSKTGSRGGGKQVDFQGSLSIKVQRVGKIRGANVNGNSLVLTAEHNSYAEDSRKIFVDCVWWDEPAKDDDGNVVLRPDGKPNLKQRTVFDWHGATVRLILEGEGTVWTKAKKLTGLVKDSVSKAHSKKLGYPAGKQVPYSVLGRAISNDAELMTDLRDLFGVRMRKRFRKGVSYDKQLAALREMASLESNDSD